jgi:PAS domain S-box-containing protein
VRGSDVQKVLRAVREEAPIPPRLVCPTVPPALESECLRALAKGREDRFDSAMHPAREVQGWKEIERRQAEEALHESEALYHSLVETLPLCIWRKDRESRFTFANKRLCDALGRSLEEVLGKLDSDFLPTDLAEKYRNDDAWVIMTGKALEQAEEHVTVQGVRLHIEVHKIPILESRGEIIAQPPFRDKSTIPHAVLSSLSDITDRTRLEEDLRTARAEADRLRKEIDGTYPRPATSTARGVGPRDA